MKYWELYVVEIMLLIRHFFTANLRTGRAYVCVDYLSVYGCGLVAKVCRCPCPHCPPEKKLAPPMSNACRPVKCTDSCCRAKAYFSPTVSETERLSVWNLRYFILSAYLFAENASSLYISPLLLRCRYCISVSIEFSSKYRLHIILAFCPYGRLDAIMQLNYKVIDSPFIKFT